MVLQTKRLECYTTPRCLGPSHPGAYVRYTCVFVCLSVCLLEREEALLFFSLSSLFCVLSSELLLLKGLAHSTTRVLRNPAMPGPLTPRQRRTVCGDDETPLKEPRDSTRSALLTAVHSRPTGLAVHPRRVLHDPAAPDWRGERECRA